MFRGVSSARSALTEGAVAVVTGDPEAAVPRFEHAAEAADSALAAFEHPSIGLARRLPWVGDNLGAVEAVALASRRSADAGLAMVEAARILGWHDLRHPGGRGDRRRGPRDDPRRPRPALDEVATELGAARSPSSRPPTPDASLGPVADGYEDAVETLQRRAKIALDTRDLVELLPRFLGTGAERRYLLAIQTLGRPQGTGGEVDLIGVLSARDGVDRPRLPRSTPAGAGVRAGHRDDRRPVGRREPARRRARRRASASSTAWCSPIPCGSPTPSGRPARSR